MINPLRSNMQLHWRAAPGQAWIMNDSDLIQKRAKSIANNLHTWISSGELHMVQPIACWLSASFGDHNLPHGYRKTVNKNESLEKQSFRCHEQPQLSYYQLRTLWNRIMEKESALFVLQFTVRALTRDRLFCFRTSFKLSLYRGSPEQWI